MAATAYRDYSQAELDAQYDQRTLVPDLSPYLARWRAASALAGERLRPEVGVPYGDHPEEVLDVFRPGAPGGAPSPLHVHCHGGAWRMLASRDAWFVAPPWVAAGHVFVSVNFALVPAVPLAVQVEQVRRALAWCRDRAPALGADPARISVSGHSSGAHLAAMAALATPDAGRPPLRGIILASGLYDLEPVRLSARNEYLDLDEAQARALGPVHHLEDRTPPCAVVWSSRELAEFQRQSSELADRLQGRGTVVRHPVDDETHFETWDRITPALLPG